MKPCCQKHKHRNPAEKKSLQNRLRRIDGQIRGLQKMVEEDAYCTDIIVQVSAVRAALQAFSNSLLKTHIQTCVIEDIKNDKLEVVDDLIDTIQKLTK